MSVLNYSQWDHIEVSDDEDDTHPNIDTPSLFKWRHEARLERDKQWKQEKQNFEESYQKHRSDYLKLKTKYEEAKKNISSDLKKLEDEWKAMQETETKWEKDLAEFKKKEKYRPKNIDNLCKEGKSYSSINHIKDEPDPADDPETAVERLKNFVDKHEAEIKTYGMFRKHEDTKKYLLENIHLVCEETTNHLLLWCIDLAMEEKFNLMNHVSHQCIVMQFMLELRKTKKYSQRELINLFFSKLINPEPDYQKAFDDELEAFRDRIRQRAKVRIQEATEKYEIEEREKRLGPGGLDPLEVMEELPDELKKCFETRDTEMLKEVFLKMKPEDAKMWYQKCVDSGLWVENAKDIEEDSEKEGVYIEEPEDDIKKEDERVEKMTKDLSLD